MKDLGNLHDALLCPDQLQLQVRNRVGRNQESLNDLDALRFPRTYLTLQNTPPDLTAGLDITGKFKPALPIPHHETSQLISYDSDSLRLDPPHQPTHTAFRADAELLSSRPYTEDFELTEFKSSSQPHQTGSQIESLAPSMNEFVRPNCFHHAYMLTFWLGWGIGLNISPICVRW